jgi:hypothetical protein
VTTGTVTAGSLPVFSDAAGDVTNSALFQVNATVSGHPTSYIGFGTTTPIYNMQVVSDGVDPAAIDIDGYGTVGINFIGRRAEGTLAAPTGLLAGDNIFAMQGRGYGTTGFSPYSRAFMKFFAAENFTDTAQGTYISLATTQIGTSPNASATEKVRITDKGYVGVLTTTPASPLTVNGAIQSLSGGYVFPDTTTQTTAGVTLTSDGSITVTGTNTAPIIAVNPTSVALQTAIGAAVGASGTAVRVPVVVQNLQVTTATNGSPTSLFTATAAGFYRVSVYMNTSTVGTCPAGPCSVEALTLSWNDGVSSSSTTAATCSLQTPCGSSSVTPIFVGAGQAITAFGQAIGTGPAPTGGAFTAYVLVEQL